MAACKYTYKNITFTEDELDDFLLGKGKEFLDTYGDQVFSEVLLGQQENFDLLVKGRKEGNILRELHIREKTRYDDNELSNYEVNSKKYHPVTHAMEGLRRASNGTLIFPEFIVENYFKERRKDWEKGDFTVTEFNLLFPNGNKPEVLTETDFKEFEIKIQEMWDAQGKIGTEIHKIMQYYFSGRTVNGKEFLFRSYSDEQLLHNLSRFINLELVPLERIEDAIKYCRNLEDYMKKAYNSKHLKYFSEYVVHGEMLNPETQEIDNLIGMIDLVVLDDRGNVHIIDFKTSPNDYNIAVEEGEKLPLYAYSPAKKLAFAYLLNVYSRLLRLTGINTTQDVNAAPMQLTNFKKDKNGYWVYDSIKGWEGVLDNLTMKVVRDATVNDVLDDMFKELYVEDVDSGAIISIVNKYLSLLFHNKDSKTGKFRDFENTKKYSKEDIIEFTEGKIAKLPNGLFLYKDKYNSITEDTIEKVQSRLMRLLNNRQNRVSDEVNRIKLVISNASLESYEQSTLIRHEGGDIHWIIDKLSKYCTGNYRVVKTPKQFDYLGIIVLENVITNNFEILKISKNNLTKHLKMGNGRTKLTGRFEDDIVENSDSNSQMLEAVYGNIDLIETLLALNTIPKLFNHKGSIGKISVINPRWNEGLPVNNSELLYSFNKLVKHLEKNGTPLEHNYIKDGTIKFQNLAELFRDEFRTVIANNTDPKKNEISKNWNLLVSARDLILELMPNPEELLPELELIRTKMEQVWPAFKRGKYTQIHSIEEEVYMHLNEAIAELQGYKFRLQPGKDFNNYIDSWDLRKGHSGLLTDNPGVTASQNINMITSVITQAYLNVRDSLQESVAKIRLLNQALKESKGFNYIMERTVGNKYNLYRNMTYRTKTDWFFVDPNTLQTKEERDFLEYTLATINTNRYPSKTAEQLADMRLKGDERYFRVPLTGGGSIIQVSGMLAAFKDSLKRLLPSELKLRAKEKLANLMSEDSELERDINDNAHWEMVTEFDGGESDKRLERLNSKPEGYYEHDLEKLLIKHIYAYTAKREIDKVFPLIKTALIFLLFSEIGLNSKFTNGIEYILKYVKTCIFNRPDISDRDLIMREYFNMIMKSASILALGFAPRQLYQGIEGLWKDIGLILEQPDGKELNGIKHFSLDNMTKSFFNTFTELIHFGNERSKLELINELYALNDMDMNVYAQHLVDGHSLMYNFSTFLFRMASRPDFYNRLTIFLSLMRADGCWEAHKVINGKLVYDWTLDKRFNILALGLKEHPEYKKQEALYIQMARLMEIEGTRNADGTLFKMKNENGEYNPLPKAYTTLLSESYKALSDRLYGYYSHEKRSLMLASLVGALFMQMYTYWSGKKNLFFAPGSVKNQGKYIHVEGEIDGVTKPLYYQLKPNGEIDFDAAPVHEVTGAPVILWQGMFSEGVITTLANIGASLYNGLHNGQNTIDIFKEYWDNPNENLRTAYRSNITKLSYDMLVFMIIGGYFGGSMVNAAKQYVKDNTTDAMDALLVLINTHMLLAANIFKASAMDFNFAESIFGRGVSWTPFSFLMYTNLLKNWGYCLSGKRDFRDTVIRSFSATRQTKPLWEFVWPKSEEEN